MKTNQVQVTQKTKKEIFNSSLIKIFKGKLLLILIGLIVISVSTQAQTIVDDAYIKIGNVVNGNIACTYVIEVNTTTDIEEVELLLGTVKDGNDLFNCIYNINGQSGLPPGINYLLTGNKLEFSGSNIPEQSLYYGRVKLKVNGSWGTPFYFISN